MKWSRKVLLFTNLVRLKTEVLKYENQIPLWWNCKNALSQFAKTNSHLSASREFLAHAVKKIESHERAVKSWILNFSWNSQWIFKATTDKSKNLKFIFHSRHINNFMSVGDSWQQFWQSVTTPEKILAFIIKFYLSCDMKIMKINLSFHYGELEKEE